MAKSHHLFARVRDLFLALPDVVEDFPWGSPHYKVNGKIIGGFGDGDEAEDAPTVGFKLEKEHAAALVESDRRASAARYVGKHGWVSFELRGRVPWRRLEAWIEESYRLVAPKRSVAKLDAR